MPQLLLPHEPYVTTEQLLADIRRTAERLRRPTLTLREYREHGSYDLRRMYGVFGSWFTALHDAGLQPSRTQLRVSKADLLADVKRVARTRSQETLTIGDYNRLGKYHAATVAHAFGGWTLAMEHAGLRTGGKVRGRNHGSPSHRGLRS